MTTLESRLADYRRQVEAKDAEIRALSAHEHALFESLGRCRRVIDVLLERLEPEPKLEPKSEPKSEPEPEPGPEPKPEEMVRIWDKWDLSFVARDGSTIFLRKWAEDFIAARPASAGRYELQPVARRKVTEVTVRVKGNGTDPLVGAELAIYLEHGVQSWLGTVTRVEERDADD